MLKGSEGNQRRKKWCLSLFSLVWCLIYWMLAGSVPVLVYVWERKCSFEPTFSYLTPFCKSNFFRPPPSTPPPDVLSCSTTHRSAGGWQAGVLLSAPSGKRHTSLTQRAAETSGCGLKIKSKKLKIQQRNSQSRTGKVVPDSLFLLVGRGEKVQRAQESPAHSQIQSLFRLCWIIYPCV